MCFAQQRRALFEDLNFQKCSEAGVSRTSWLGFVLRATTACTFWTSQLPKVLRSWCALYILTWTCASRHNGVQRPKVLRSWCALYILALKCALRHNSLQFFISHLATWLRTRRFREPTFGPSGATNHWKNTVFCDFFYLVAHLHLSSDSFSSLIFSCLLFSDSSHLCFFICPYCRKFDWLLNFLQSYLLYLYMYMDWWNNEYEIVSHLTAIG